MTRECKQLLDTQDGVIGNLSIGVMLGKALVFGNVGMGHCLYDMNNISSKC